MLDFMMYYYCPEVQRIMAPFLKTQFSRKKICKDAELIIPDCETIMRLVWPERERIMLLDRLLRLHGSKEVMVLSGCRDLRLELEKFLGDYGEGALVVLAHILMARYKYPLLQELKRKYHKYPVGCWPGASYPRVDSPGLAWPDSVNFDIVVAIDSIPDCLKPRVLKAGEREALITQCRNDINTDGAKAAVEIVREFGEFCELLSQPDNHIKVKSGQLIEGKSACGQSRI